MNNNLFFDYVKDKIKDIPCSIYLDLTIKQIKIDNFIEYMNRKYSLNNMLFFDVTSHIQSNGELDTHESYCYLINNKVYFKFNTMLMKDKGIIITDMTMYSNLLNSEMSLDINNYVMDFDELTFNRKQKIEKINKK